MSHANALLAPAGRLRLARCIVDDGWSLRRAAERFQVSRARPRNAGRLATATHGEAGMDDRSSRPHCAAPSRTPTRTERRIVKLRWLRRWGPARIGFHLGLHPSTVHKVLSRFKMARLAGSTRPPGSGRDLLTRRAATSTPSPATWSTSTSRSSAGSPTAAVGESSDKARHRRRHTQRPTCRPIRRRTVARVRVHPSTPSTTTPGWPTPRSSPTRSKETAAGFWDRAQRLLRRPRHRGPAGADRQRQLLPIQSVRRRARPRSRTSGPARTGPRPTARSNGSTAPCSKNGPTPTSTSQRPTVQPRSRSGCITTIITAATPASKASHPSSRVTNLPGQNGWLRHLRRAGRPGAGAAYGEAVRPIRPPAPRPPAAGRLQPDAGAVDLVVDPRRVEVMSGRHGSDPSSSSPTTPGTRLRARARPRPRASGSRSCSIGSSPVSASRTWISSRLSRTRPPPGFGANG